MKMKWKKWLGLHAEEPILVKRLRNTYIIFALFFLGTVVFASKQYIDSREHLLHDLSVVEGSIQDISNELNWVKHDNRSRMTELANNYNGQFTRMARFFNVYEQYRFEHASYNHASLFVMANFIEVLHKRYKLGFWSERDQQALDKMESYLRDYQKVLTDERLKLNNVNDLHFNALFDPVDVEEMLELHKKMNYLAYTYGEFQAFPNEETILSSEKVKDKLTQVFNMEDGKVELPYSSKEAHIKDRGYYDFLITNKKRSVSGRINAYTGNVISFQDISNHDGEKITNQQAMDKVEAFFQTGIAKNLDYKMIEMGKDYNTTKDMGNPLLSYHVTPIYKGYPFNVVYRIYVGESTGDLESMRVVEGQGVRAKLPIGSRKETISVEDGIGILKDQYPNKKVTFQETLYIPSILTNQYELVHRYAVERLGEKYINIGTGDMDVAY